MTVKMVDPKTGKTADVHPSEVKNWEADGWRAVGLALLDEAKRINRMSRLKALGGHVRDGIAALEQDAEKLATRLEGLKERGAAAFGKLREELDAYEQAVTDAEQSLSQMSNGGPALGNQ